MTAKHSIEKKAAANSDVFLTVSGITAVECRYLLGHEADAVTPNGFEDDFVWQGDDYRVKREEARTALIAVAEACLGRKLQDDPLIVGTSGRYEFRNKGLDVLLEGMKRLAGLERLEREVVLYVMVPAANRGARADLQKHLGRIPRSRSTARNGPGRPIIWRICSGTRSCGRSTAALWPIPRPKCM